MPLSIGLLLLACGASAWLAYGMDPRVAQYMGGLEFVCLSRRLQWVLAVLAVLPSLLLIVRVVLGRARAWWMIGLSIVLAMLLARFGPGSIKPVRVIDADAMPTINEVQLPSEDEFVVGFDLGERSFALPYRCLVRTPIVQLTDFDRRVLVIASPRANLVSVIEISRQSRAEEFVYVAEPGNSTLVYNRKHGRFIVGVTARDELGRESPEVIDVLPSYRMPMRQWRRVRPDTRLLAPNEADLQRPGLPLNPLYPPADTNLSLPADTPVTLVRGLSPMALLSGQSFEEPVNVSHDESYVTLWQDGVFLRAFNRMAGDLILTFQKKTDAKNVRFADAQTRSMWTPEGLCIDGPLKGTRLRPLRVDEGVYWGVCKEWWPTLALVRPAEK